MTDDTDNTSDFSPDEINDSPAKEYNPYSNFLNNEASEENATDVVEFTESKTEVPVNTSENNSEEKPEPITTESDINLPDFLNPSVNMSSFENGISHKNDDVSDSTNKDNPTPSYSETINEDKTVPNDSENTEIQEWHNRPQPEKQEINSVPDSNQTTQLNENPSSPNTSNESKNDTGSHGGDTNDKEVDKRFVPKVSASEADKRPGSKPRILNKKLLLTLIICIVGCIFLITFLMPAGKQRKNKKEKPVAETHASTDYSSIANKHSIPDEQDAQESYHYGNTTEKEEEDDVEIPPVVSDKKPTYTPQNVNYSTGKGNGTSSIEIPDTRNDSLRGKTIVGIKGLTPAQQSYSTDYQQTIAKNLASTTSNSANTLPSKEEYMNSVLSAYSQVYGNSGSQNAYALQNDQSGKNAFYNNGRNGENVGQGEWLNLNTLWQGSIFEAVLTSELNTDLPGEITARVAKNIYSSQDGRFLLIPQNSVLYGTYNSSISYSQSRVQVGWHTLIRPDGYQIQLGNMNGTDAKGASGLKGFVNDHPMAYLKAIGLMSVFSIVNSEFEASMGNTQNQYVQNIIANSQQVTMELADKLIDRAMNVQPTIKIKSGTKINIVVNQNLTLPPVEDIPVTQAYHRQR